jgi:hypothetical protein
MINWANFHEKVHNLKKSFSNRAEACCLHLAAVTTAASGAWSVNHKCASESTAF